MALALSVGLLGQGERCSIDARFSTPTTTLSTYWNALRSDDDATAIDCLLEGPYDVPYPGALWFMPPTEWLELDAFRSLPVTAGRVLVTYEVRFLPVGASLEQRFTTSHELVRGHGEWRIARTIGEAGMPEWKPIPRAVDI